MRAAATSGADAVYFGVDAFNTRQRAENFRLDDLPPLMQWLHQRVMLAQELALRDLERLQTQLV